MDNAWEGVGLDDRQATVITQVNCFQLQVVMECCYLNEIFLHIKASSNEFFSPTHTL